MAFPAHHRDVADMTSCSHFDACFTPPPAFLPQQHPPPPEQIRDQVASASQANSGTPCSLLVPWGQSAVVHWHEGSGGRLLPHLEPIKDWQPFCTSTKNNAFPNSRICAVKVPYGISSLVVWTIAQDTGSATGLRVFTLQPGTTLHAPGPRAPPALPRHAIPPPHILHTCPW